MTFTKKLIIYLILLGNTILVASYLTLVLNFNEKIVIIFLFFMYAYVYKALYRVVNNTTPKVGNVILLALGVITVFLIVYLTSGVIPMFDKDHFLQMMFIGIGIAVLTFIFSPLIQK